ncbi:hypothetical protein SBOR_3709 [Sclerotinia borealis F-4128]|uniref:Uncharacterized protein n=1 Tax=Sclerotinia borealis (strain F-4128) TaxID=1432307 RepID=W9CJ68_SCLBF|nr:hypothetical protein SBOR_3709 [Sclerotinia borealis F-4128]
MSSSHRDRDSHVSSSHRDKDSHVSSSHRDRDSHVSSSHRDRDSHVSSSHRDRDSHVSSSHRDRDSHVSSKSHRSDESEVPTQCSSVVPKGSSQPLSGRGSKVPSSNVSGSKGSSQPLSDRGSKVPSSKGPSQPLSDRDSKVPNSNVSSSKGSSHPLSDRGSKAPSSKVPSSKVPSSKVSRQPLSDRGSDDRDGVNARPEERRGGGGGSGTGTTTSAPSIDSWRNNQTNISDPMRPPSPAPSAISIANTLDPDDSISQVDYQPSQRQLSDRKSKVSGVSRPGEKQLISTQSRNPPASISEEPESYYANSRTGSTRDTRDKKSDDKKLVLRGAKAVATIEKGLIKRHDGERRDGSRDRSNQDRNDRDDSRDRSNQDRNESPGHDDESYYSESEYNRNEPISKDSKKPKMVSRKPKGFFEGMARNLGRDIIPDVVHEDDAKRGKSYKVEGQPAMVRRRTHAEQDAKDAKKAREEEKRAKEARKNSRR